MTDEQEMKLQALHIADGSLALAKDIYAWLSTPEKPAVIPATPERSTWAFVPPPPWSSKDVFFAAPTGY